MKSVFFVILFSLLSLEVYGQNGRTSASATVREFYRIHFQRADRMAFEPQNIRRIRKSLTPELYRMLMSEFEREAANAKANPDLILKPFISGDIFTDSESPPQVFKITDATQFKNTAIITVWVYWNDETIGKMKRKIKVVMVSSANRWLIGNVIYEDGDLLNRLKRAKTAK